jgi:hypothetical protein
VRDVNEGDLIGPELVPRLRLFYRDWSTAELAAAAAAAIALVSGIECYNTVCHSRVVAETLAGFAAQ